MNFIVDAPNISIDRINDVRGQLVTPQNTLTIPHAAHNPTGSPNIGAKKLPSVAPTKRVGTISPPLKPAPRVRAVKMIFKRKASGATVPSKHLEIILTPVPL